MSIYDKLVGATAEGELPPAVREHLPAKATTALASSATTAYWVSPTGSDTAAGTVGAPFRTLAKAVSMIPDIVRAGHTYTLNLLAGDWGSETLEIHNRLIYGDLLVTGTTGNRDNHKVHRVHLKAVFGCVRVENITATRAGTLSGPAFWFQSAMPWIDVDNVKTVPVDASIREQSGVIGLLADYGSVVRAQNSEFNGRRYGLRANYSSRIYSKDNTGTGNVFGLGARWGGIMSAYGTQPGGETALTTDSGGIISQGMGAKVGVPTEMGLVEAQEGSQGRFVRKRWLLRHGNSIGWHQVSAGQRVRLTFRLGSVSNIHAIKVDFSYSPIVGSGTHFVQTVFNSIITDTAVTTPAPSVIARRFGSGMNADDMVQLNHSGSGGIFYIDLVPRDAGAGWLGADIEISNMRDYDAPTLLSADIA